jgi:tetratricopeptide (TPR) repeat protein
MDYILHPSKAEELPDYGYLRRRYVGFLTFALNYKLHGLDVWGYHVFNVSIHILNALLVYAFVVLTLRTPYFNGSALRKNSGFLALFSGLLFVSHPVQIEAVTYIYQRMASLVFFFYILAMILYVKYRLASLKEGVASRSLLVYYLPAVFCIILAVKTKENSLTLPFAVMLYECFFFSGSKKIWPFLIPPLFLPLILYPLALYESGLSVGIILFGADPDVSEIVSRSTFDSDYLNPSERRWSYLLTQSRVAVTYMRLLLFPANQNLDYDYPVFKSFFDPQVVLSVFFLFGVFALGIYLFHRSRITDYSSEFGEVTDPRDRSSGIRSSLITHHLSRLVAFGIFWFFLTLSVESSIIPLPMLIQEYRVYLPSVGVFFMLSSATFALVNAVKNRAIKKVAVCICIFIVLALSSATYARNTIWRSNVSLWEDVVRKSPNKARPHHNLGKAYKAQDMIDKAIEHYMIALSLEPDAAIIHNNLGNAYLAKGMTDKAIDQYKTALTLQPDFEKAYFNLGNAYRSKGMADMAIKYYQSTIRLKPIHAKAHFNLGGIYLERGHVDKAVEHFLTAVGLQPDYAEAHNNLGKAYRTMGMEREAIEHYERAIGLKPDFAEPHINLGIIYKSRGLMEKAIEHFRQAISLNPDLPDAHYNIGNAYMTIGLTDLAIEHYRQAISIRPEDPDDGGGR